MSTVSFVRIDFYPEPDFDNKAPMQFMLDNNIRLLVLPTTGRTHYRSRLLVLGEPLNELISNNLHAVYGEGLDLIENLLVFPLGSLMSPRELLLAIKELLTDQKISYSILDNAKKEMARPFILYAHSYEVAHAIMAADSSVDLVLVPNHLKSGSLSAHTIIMRNLDYIEELQALFGDHKCTLKVHACYAVSFSREFIEDQITKHTQIQIGF